MIEFSEDFTSESSEYVLFEMPEELKQQLQRGETLRIQEYKTDSYIVGQKHLYQVIKSQISNLLLVSEVLPHKENCFRVRSFQQSFLIPTAVKSFSRDILIHLKSNATSEEDDLDKEELSVEYIKTRFVSNQKGLEKVLKSLGAEILKGYIVNLAIPLRENLFKWIFGQIRDRGLCPTKEARFRFVDLGPLAGPVFDRMHFAEKKLEVTLNTYFSFDESSNSYSLSLEGLIEACLLKIKRETNELYLEDLVDQLKEQVVLTIPRSLLDSFGEEQINLEIEACIKRCYMIADNIDYTLGLQSYSPRQALAVLSDADLLAEQAIDR